MRRGCLREILTAVERCRRIAGGLLGFARRQPLELGPVDTAGVLRATLEMREARLTAAGIEVAMDVAGDLPPVRGDAHQLQQVFLNVLVNAEQALAEGGRTFRVTARRADEYGPQVVIEFCNDGPPIPADQLPRVFEPLFTTKPTDEGTGLGLYICQRIVSEHGGEITVRSQPGRAAARAGGRARRRRHRARPRAGVGGAPRPFVVAGVFERPADPSRIARNELEVRFHLPDLEALLPFHDRVDRFAVVLAPGADADAAARWIEGIAFGTRAYGSAALAEEASATFLVISRFHDAIGIVTILASAIFLLCVMIIRVDERRADVARCGWWGSAAAPSSARSCWRRSASRWSAARWARRWGWACRGGQRALRAGLRHHAPLRAGDAAHRGARGGGAGAAAGRGGRRAGGVAGGATPPQRLGER
jgi:hypothetical protein